MYANISLPLRNQNLNPVLLLLVMDAVPIESTVADTAPAVMDPPPTALQWCRACCGLFVFIVKNNSRGSATAAFRRVSGGLWGYSGSVGRDFKICSLFRMTFGPLFFALGRPSWPPKAFKIDLRRPLFGRLFAEPFSVSISF